MKPDDASAPPSGIWVRRRVVVLIIALLALAASAVGAAAWFWSFDRGLSRLEAAGETRIAFTLAALEKDLSRRKLLAKSLAETGAVRDLALGRGGAAAAERILLRLASVGGARDISVETEEGATPGPARQAVALAYQGSMGLSYDDRGEGAFVLAAPVWSGTTVVGAVVATVDAPRLEFAWRALPEVVIFASSDGRVRLASRPSLRLRALPGSEAADAPTADVEEADVLGRRIWRPRAAGWDRFGVTAEELLVLKRPAPSVGMEALILTDLEPARRDAALAAAAAATTTMALGLLVLIGLQRRAALRDRLAVETAANLALEGRVARRTAALRQEVGERIAAETALRETQESLIQAGKLSALGRMAAGIAHEINQPLAAIRSYAENGATLMDRGRDAEARENLSQIAQLTDRAARIIRNLRAFARNAPEPATPTPLDVVVEDALALIAPRAREMGAEIEWRRPAAPVRIMGGAVRLQQVVVNLIANALDAQQGADRPWVAVELDEADGAVRLTVRDRGEGLSEEVRDRLFDPFFSTKSEGGDGLGLGLSISYGIVRSFGGDLQGVNHPEGGAVFTAAFPAMADEAGGDAEEAAA